MLYPFKEIRDIPVFYKISAKDLIQKLSNNLNNQTKVVTNHPVKCIKQEGNDWIIDDIYKVKSIIIATGNGAFTPKKLPLKTTPDIDSRIHYFINDPNFFKNKQVGIFGGGDSALDYTLELAKLCQISLIHRRPQFRGLESSVEKAKSLKNIEILTPYLPKEINLVDNRLRVTLKHVASNKTLERDFDQIIVAYGFKARNQFLKKWGIELSNQRIRVNSDMQTNLTGVYSVGDAIYYPGRIPIIGVGFGEAQIAINSIMRDLFPEKTLTIHSTSM